MEERSSGEYAAGPRSGNFLKDRGYSDPTETRIKFDLVSIIRAVIEAKSLRQIDVVALVGRYAPGTGIGQPDISRILRGNVNGDRVVIRWKFHFEWLDGTVTHMEELACQRWEGERIAEETFFYDPSQRVPQRQP